MPNDQSNVTLAGRRVGVFRLLLIRAVSLAVA
jgi:hypothetical protein